MLNEYFTPLTLFAYPDCLPSLSDKTSSRQPFLSQTNEGRLVEASHVHDPAIFLDGLFPDLTLPTTWMNNTETLHGGIFPEHFLVNTQHDRHDSHIATLSDTTTIAAPPTLETRPSSFSSATSPFPSFEGEGTQLDGGVHHYVAKSLLSQNDLLTSPTTDSKEGEVMVSEKSMTPTRMVLSEHSQFLANKTTVPSADELIDTTNSFQSPGVSNAGSTNEISKNTDASTKIWKCTWPGCRSRTKFGRQYEYNRHMKKHTKVNTIACPVIYCHRQDSKPFYRWDKLFDHLKTGHAESELCRCLVKGCMATNLPINLLRLHATHHEIDLSEYPDLLSSHDFLKVFRSFTMARKCDLKTCKKWFSATETSRIQEHILTHEETHRRRQQSVIQRMGYDPITARVRCPMCCQTFETSEEFVPHLESAHLATNYEHWLSFKQHVGSDDPAAPKFIWQRWTRQGGAAEESYCQHCGGFSSSQGDGWIDHHLQLLKVSDTTKIHRADILRLVPSFASHPVFESDLPTVHLVSYPDYTSLALPSGDESFVKIAPTLVAWSSME